MKDLSGNTLKGYEFREQIGAGGFGAIYHAFQPVLKREVAVKVIRPDHANDPDFIRRFEVEAELVAQLEHPHIVPLFDFWREPDSAFLVMRLLRGGSLRERIEQGPVDIESIAKILDQIGSALAAAHQRGVIHLDIKPDNILLDEADNAYLTDFGIAKNIDVESADMEDEIRGSIYYIAPEQLQQQKIGPYTDIYGLGIVLYELVTGEHPFSDTGTISELIFKHLQDDLPSLYHINPNLPSELDDVILRATAKNPLDRYSSTMEFAAAFRKAITTEDIYVDISQYETELDAYVELVNPYKGLRAFQEFDSGDFYGRESLIEELIEKMTQDGAAGRFLAVVGPSGSGKSSVVRAGLIPTLRDGALSGSQNWFVLEMYPGAHPFAELEAALLRVAVNPPSSLMEQLQEEDGLLRAIKRVLPGDESTELVLMIDQFEELFTLVEDEAVRAHFLNSLLKAVDDPRSRLRVIITLRADFYDRPLHYRAFGERLDDSKVTVYPLSAAELEAVIARPAEQVGAFLESGLTQKIIADVGEQPGTLPLLQYALTELFERRDGRLLTLEAYDAIGGVTGALARRADEIFLTLNPERQNAARQLFLRLVTPGEGTEDTRRRARFSELLSINGDMQAVLDQFAPSRLLTFDNDPMTREPTIEVAHEALIRTWQRLRHWLTESRETLLLQRRLNMAAVEWSDAGQNSGYLARDVRLRQFETLLDVSTIQLNDIERSYILESVVAREAQEAQEQQRLAHERALEKRSANRLRYLAAALLVFLLVASGLSLLAFNQSQTAQNERDNVQTQVLIAERNAATATVAQGEAVEQAGTAAAAVVTATLAQGEAIKQASTAAAAAITATVAQGEAIDQASTADAAAQAESYARATAVFERDRADLQSQIAISQRIASQSLREVENRPDVALLLSLEAFRRNENYDTRSALLTAINNRPNEAIFLRDMTNTTVTASAISSDNQWLALAGDNYEIGLWNLQTGEQVGSRWIVPGQQPLAMRFSEDNQQLVTVDVLGDIVVWEVPTGNVARLDTLGLTYRSPVAVMNNDGSVVALVNVAQAQITLYNLNTTEVIAGPFTSTMTVPTVINFSPDGTRLAVGDLGVGDGTVEIWNITTQELEMRLPAPLEGAILSWYGPVFSPNGDKLVVSYLSAVYLWNLETQTPHLIGTNDFTYSTTSATFSPDGSRFFITDRYNAIHVVNSETYEIQPTILVGHDVSVEQMVMSPDGDTLLSYDEGGLTILWQLDGSQILNQFVPLDLEFYTAISPDGTQIATAAEDIPVLEFHDATTGNVINTIQTGHESRIVSVAYSPDGLLVATGDEAGQIYLWDVASGMQFGNVLSGHQDDIRLLVFSPDSSLLVSTGSDAGLNVWDVATTTLKTDLVIDETRPDASEFVVLAGAFSPDNRWLTLAALNGRVYFWDVQTFELVKFIELLTFPYALAFSPDSKILALPDNNNVINLLDVDTLQPFRRSLVGHTGLIYSVAFSPDGSMLVSADEDLYVWDIQTGQLIGSPLNMTRTQSSRVVSDVVFSPDGQQIISTFGLGVVLWNLSFENLEDAVCSQVNLNFSLDEWTRFFPNEPFHPTCPNSGDQLIDFIKYAETVAHSGDTETARQLYQTAAEWASQITDETIIIPVCLGGMLNGYADVILPACDRIVEKSTYPWDYRVSRAYARAMTGDLAGAIEDMKVSVEWVELYNGWMVELGYNPLTELMDERTGWLARLQAGENPFVEKEAQYILRNRYEILTAEPESVETPADTSIFGPVTSFDVFEQLTFDAMILSAPTDMSFGVLRVEDMSDNSVQIATYGEWAPLAINGDAALTVNLTGQGVPTVLNSQSDAEPYTDIEQWFNQVGRPTAPGLQLVTIAGVQVAITDDFAAYMENDALITFVSTDDQDQMQQGMLRNMLIEMLPNAIAYSEYKLYVSVTSVSTYVDNGDSDLAEATLKDTLPSILATDNPDLNNITCWIGSTHGFAEIVLPACDHAVELGESTPQFQVAYRDSRGLARALTSDYTGAISDFQTFVDTYEHELGYAPLIAKRKLWISELQEGRNPFDDDTLNELRDE